jgi:hypothetical protein
MTSLSQKRFSFHLSTDPPAARALRPDPHDSTFLIALPYAASCCLDAPMRVSQVVFAGASALALFWLSRACQQAAGFNRP